MLKDGLSDFTLALFTSAGKISASRERTDAAISDEGIIAAIVEEENVVDGLLAGDRKLAEEVNKAIIYDHLYISEEPQQTIALSRLLAPTLQPGDVVCFYGNLGAGKTTFIKGLVEELCGIDAGEVSSPTFVILNAYHGNTTLYHFDLYRIDDPVEFDLSGFQEYFYAGGVCCVEWSEKIAHQLPNERIDITINHCGRDKRSIKIVKRS